MPRVSTDLRRAGCQAEGCDSKMINPGKHGRDETSDLDLCDVCYWRKRAESNALPDADYTLTEHGMWLTLKRRGRRRKRYSLRAYEAPDGRIEVTLYPYGRESDNRILGQIRI